MVVKHNLAIVLYLSDVLTDQHVQSLQVGALIDDNLVLAVSRGMLHPCLQIDCIEDI